MNKKALSWRFMIAVILALALVIIFIFFKSEILAKYKYKVDEDRCEATVFREYLIKHSSGKDFADSIECKQISKDIKDTDENKITRGLLRDAYRCWQMFGKSDLDLFKDYGSFCHLCYTEHFNKKGIVVNDLLQASKDIVVPGKGFSYWGGMNLYIQPELRTQFKTDKDLAVVFSFIRVGSKSDYTELLETVGSVAPGWYLVSKIGEAAGIFVKHTESKSAETLRQVFDDLGFAPPELGGSGPPLGYFYVGIVEYTPERLNQFACDWTPIQKE